MAEKSVVLSCLREKKYKQGKIDVTKSHWCSFFLKVAKLTNAFWQGVPLATVEFVFKGWRTSEEVHDCISLLKTFLMLFACY